MRGWRSGNSRREHEKHRAPCASHPIICLPPSNVQSRRQSLIETVISTLVGLTLSFFLQVLLAHLLHYRTTYSQDALAVALFTLLSLIRGYGIRRFFNWLWRGR